MPLFEMPVYYAANWLPGIPGRKNEQREHRELRY